MGADANLYLLLGTGNFFYILTGKRNATMKFLYTDSKMKLYARILYTDGQKKRYNRIYTDGQKKRYNRIVSG